MKKICMYGAASSPSHLAQMDGCEFRKARTPTEAGPTVSLCTETDGYYKVLHYTQCRHCCTFGLLLSTLLLPSANSGQRRRTTYVQTVRTSRP